MSKHDLPLKALMYFSVVAKAGSFKQAANTLCVTPQAVSIQMKRLEQHLGVILFHRDPTGVQLTSAGEVLVEYVARSLLLLEQGITLASGCEKTSYRINISPWFAVHRVLPALHRFESQLVDVELRVSTQVAMTEKDWHMVDVAIQWGFGDWPAQRKQLLLKDDKCLVCAPSLLQRSSLATISDLQEQRIICTPLSVALWQRYARTLGIDLLRDRQFLTVDSIASQVEATQQGLGVALLSEPVARNEVAAGRLVMPLGNEPISVLNPALVPGYWLIVPNHCRDLHIAYQFEHWLNQLLATPPDS